MHLLLLFQVLWMTWRPQEFHVLVLQPKQLSWRPVRAFPRPSWNVTASPQLATGPSPTPSRPVTTSARQYYRRICEAIHFIKVTVLVLDCWKLVLVQLNWRSSWDWRWGFLFTVKDCLWLRSFVFRAVKRIKSDTVKEDGSFLPQMVSWVNDLRCNDRLSDERSRTEQSGINRFVTFIDKGEGKRGKKMSCAQWEPFLWSCKASWAEQQLPYSDSLHPYGSQTHSPTAARTANVKWCTKKNILCSVSASVQCMSVAAAGRQRKDSCCTLSRFISSLWFSRADFPALVVKASGLAAGKGVIVARDQDEACQAVMDIMKVWGY